MKTNAYFFIPAIFILIASGCAENQTRVGEGAAIGGGLGALAGGIIGHQTHSTATGILIGGAVGAASGAVVGAQIPKNQPPSQYAQPINQVTMQQVVDWTRQGVSNDEIISRIRSTNSVYALTPDDINYLRKQGVSQRVVETMQAAH